MALVPPSDARLEIGRFCNGWPAASTFAKFARGSGYERTARGWSLLRRLARPNRRRCAEVLETIATNLPTDY